MYWAGPVTRIPDRGNVDFIEEIRLTVAGTAGGTVVDTAKLGLNSLAVGAVGDDEKADWVLMTLQKHGIDTSAMQRHPGVPTSATILNVRPNGERPALACARRVGPFRRADLRLRPGLRCADHPSGRHRAAAAARWAGQRHDPAEGGQAARPHRHLRPHRRQCRDLGIVLPLLPYIDYFMPSIEEAQDMSGQIGPEDCADFYLDKGATACVFTLGGDGAYYAHATARASHRPPTTLRWSIPPAAATPSMPASSRRSIIDGHRDEPALRAGLRRPSWPRDWAPTPASSPSRQRSPQ